MRINHNIAALNTYRQLTNNNSIQQKSLAKLSSGFRINNAADDAAGLAISEKMRGQIRGLEMATKNAQDGISLIQTAEGALNETHSILQRMRELAVQSSNDTNTDADRAELQKEVDQLAQELTRIANNTEFNTKSLLNGAVNDSNVKAAVFQIGANEGQSLTLTINAMDAYSLGVARDTLSAEVATGATAISSASVDDTSTVGSSIVAGETVTVTTADHTGINATGTLDVNGNTITADFGSVGTAGNGIKIVFGNDSDAAVNATWDSGTNTVTITADWDGSSGSDPANLAAIEAAIQGADGSLSGVTLTESGSFSAADFADAGTITLSGGEDADASKTIVTFTDSSSNTQSIVVSDTATEVSVSSGIFKGLSFTTTDVTSASGDISITETKASAATFSSGEKTADAVAGGGINISTQENADAAITSINKALETVSAERSKLGAYQNRLEHTIANLGTSAENLTAAESRIRDIDMAKEMMEFTKMNILSQAAQAMLAQANQLPQGVLQLLR